MTLFGIGLMGVIAIVVWQYLQRRPAFEDEPRKRDHQDDVLQAIESMQEGRPGGDRIDEESSPDT